MQISWLKFNLYAIGCKDNMREKFHSPRDIFRFTHIYWKSSSEVLKRFLSCAISGLVWYSSGTFQQSARGNLFSIQDSEICNYWQLLTQTANIYSNDSRTILEAVRTLKQKFGNSLPEACEAKWQFSHEVLKILKTSKLYSWNRSQKIREYELEKSLIHYTPD